MESFKAVIRNKWQAWSLAIAAKHFLLKQRCQVEGRILNIETILFLTKTRCFDFIAKTRKYHSLPLPPGAGSSVVWWQCWDLGRVSAPPCSKSALLQDGVHTAVCALCLGTSTSKRMRTREKTLLTRGVVMAGWVGAFTQGCGGKMWLLWALCPEPGTAVCKGAGVCTSPTFATASLERCWASPCCWSQWASSGVWPKPDPALPKSSFAVLIHIHLKSHCRECPPHKDILCWTLEWVC